MINIEDIKLLGLPFSRDENGEIVLTQAMTEQEFNNLVAEKRNALRSSGLKKQLFTIADQKQIQVEKNLYGDELTVKQKERLENRYKRALVNEFSQKINNAIIKDYEAKQKILNQTIDIIEAIQELANTQITAGETAHVEKSLQMMQGINQDTKLSAITNTIKQIETEQTKKKQKAQKVKKQEKNK